MNLEKYMGIIPAFYACYDDFGEVSQVRVKEAVEYFVKKGVKGIYVNGSSGECIYQSVSDRKKVIEAVMEANEGRLTVINHVAANNTKDSIELSRHSKDLGVDAIAAIPPIYFKLPPYSICRYWNEISMAADGTDFIIYNIPQLAGVTLTADMYREMLKNPNVIGVKNSSLPVMDIQILKSISGDNHIIFNGPDEQFLAGRLMGADAGIGGTYAVMPELFLKLDELIEKNQMKLAKNLQNDINAIIYLMVSGYANMYAVAKEVLRINESLNLGSVRSPLEALNDSDRKLAQSVAKLINETKIKYGV